MNRWEGGSTKPQKAALEVIAALAHEAAIDEEDAANASAADVTSRRLERVRAAEQKVTDLQVRCAELEAEADLAQMRPPIDGIELMAIFGRGPGPWIRPVKDRLLEMVLDGDLAPDDKDRAIAVARQIISELEATPS